MQRYEQKMMCFCSQNCKSIAKDEPIITHLNNYVNTFLKDFYVNFWRGRAEKSKSKNGRSTCILSGESPNTTKEIFLVVFFCWCDLTKGSLREGAGAEGD